MYFERSTRACFQVSANGTAHMRVSASTVVRGSDRGRVRLSEYLVAWGWGWWNGSAPAYGGDWACCEPEEYEEWQESQCCCEHDFVDRRGRHELIGRRVCRAEICKAPGRTNARLWLRPNGGTAELGVCAACCSLGMRHGAVLVVLMRLRRNGKLAVDNTSQGFEQREDHHQEQQRSRAQPAPQGRAERGCGGLHSVACQVDHHRCHSCVSPWR